MTGEQRSIEHIKERMKGIATRGIRQTLLGIQDELYLLYRLLSAGISSSTAEVDAAYDNLEDEKTAKINFLSKQLCSIQSTIGVATCALASVCLDSDLRNDAFKKHHETDIEPALIDVLVHQPQCLDDAAAEIAMQQGDSSAMATLRRQLNSLLKEEGQADG